MNQIDNERLKADLRRVVEDVEAVLRSTANATGEQFEELRERARERLHAAHERLDHLEAEVAARGREAVRRGNAYVHAHPWTVVGIAAGCAFLLGMLAQRR